jgi:tRNA(fMet)-specific endonuclease VapC
MRFLLDTNTVSHLVRANPIALAHLVRHGTDRIFISAVTDAEIQFGLAKNLTAVRLRHAIDEFYAQIDVLDFTSATAAAYGPLRATLESSGLPMSPLDTLIAATALEHVSEPGGMTLVTNDHAFHRIAELTVEDWTTH